MSLWQTGKAQKSQRPVPRRSGQRKSFAAKTGAFNVILERAIR
jgi:hypothetical protein